MLVSMINQQGSCACLPSLSLIELTFIFVVTKRFAEFTETCTVWEFITLVAILEPLTHVTRHKLIFICSAYKLHSEPVTRLHASVTSRQGFEHGLIAHSESRASALTNLAKESDPLAGRLGCHTSITYDMRHWSLRNYIPQNCYGV